MNYKIYFYIKKIQNGWIVSYPKINNDGIQEQSEAYFDAFLDALEFLERLWNEPKVEGFWA